MLNQLKRFVLPLFLITSTYSMNAKAVEIASNNLGDVLLFPYFTTRNGYRTNVNQWGQTRKKVENEL